jgi:hypothetical protein
LVAVLPVLQTLTQTQQLGGLLHLAPIAVQLVAWEEIDQLVLHILKEESDLEAI